MSMLGKALVLMISGTVALVASSCASGVEKDVSPRHRDTYVYCNVYLGGACFGIAAGDEMQMTIPADYVLYVVKSADKRNAIVYFGYDASIVDPVLRNKFDECTATKEVCMLAIESGTGIEAVYSGSRDESTVHLLVTGILQTNKERALEFVENFRPCKRVTYDLMCRDEPVFVMP